MAYSYAQLEELWIQAGGSKSLAPLMAAIALAESGGNAGATNPNDNNGTQTSWGLWQISNGTHNKPTADILDPLTNAQYAVKKYKAQGLQAWGTYSSGSYRKFMKSGVSPSSPVTGTTPTTAQDAGLTSDLGNAIGQGLIAVMQPVFNFVLWGSEVVLGIFLLIGGVFVAIQASKTVQQVEKKTLSAALPEAAPVVAAKKATTTSTKTGVGDARKGPRGYDAQRIQTDLRNRKKAAEAPSREEQEDQALRRVEDARIRDVRRRMTAERAKARAKEKKS